MTTTIEIQSHRVATSAGIQLTPTESRLVPIGRGAQRYGAELDAIGADHLGIHAVSLETPIVKRARRSWRAFRKAHGYVGDAPLLTPPASQPKLGKSAAPTYGLMLTPERGVGLDGVNLCPAATACAQVCITYTGKGAFSSVQRARQVRTLWLLSEPELAGALIVWELLRASVRHREPIRVRLNVLSDIRWESVAPLLMSTARAFAPLYSRTGHAQQPGALTSKQFPRPGIVFYDYTAYRPELRRGGNGYRLTFSRKERGALSRPDTLRAILRSGSNVAVVFDTPRGAPLPERYLGHRVIDGDLSDDRTSDPHGVVVGLRAKGPARRDTSGFVVPVAELGD